MEAVGQRRTARPIHEVLSSFCPAARKQLLLIKRNNVKQKYLSAQPNDRNRNEADEEKEAEEQVLRELESVVFAEAVRRFTLAIMPSADVILKYTTELHLLENLSARRSDSGHVKRLADRLRRDGKDDFVLHLVGMFAIDKPLLAAFEREYEIQTDETMDHIQRIRQLKDAIMTASLVHVLSQVHNLHELMFLSSIDTHKLEKTQDLAELLVFGLDGPLLQKIAKAEEKRQRKATSNTKKKGRNKRASSFSSRTSVSPRKAKLQKTTTEGQQKEEGERDEDAKEAVEEGLPQKKAKEEKVKEEHKPSGSEQQREDNESEEEELFRFSQQQHAEVKEETEHPKEKELPEAKEEEEEELFRFSQQQQEEAKDATQEERMKEKIQQGVKQEGHQQPRQQEGEEEAVCSFLHAIVPSDLLQQVVQVFKENCIRTLQDVKHLSLDDLKDLGLVLGVRNRIWNAAKAL
ncbi:hypothetical protein QOT17_007790 [Balamuthia mandrillaris]